MSNSKQSNFKTRFAGKIDTIDPKKGGIDFMIGTASKPIKEIDALSGSYSINPPSRQSSNINSAMRQRNLIPP
jgi:hypothetical protein